MRRRSETNRDYECKLIFCVVVILFGAAVYHTLYPSFSPLMMVSGYRNSAIENKDMLVTYDNENEAEYSKYDIPPTVPACRDIL